MPFNANTYRANKARRESREAMAQAREIKARAAQGAAYDWEVQRIPLIVMNARITARLSRFYASLNEPRPAPRRRRAS